MFAGLLLLQDHKNTRRGCASFCQVLPLALGKRDDGCTRSLAKDASGSPTLRQPDIVLVGLVGAQTCSLLKKIGALHDIAVDLAFQGKYHQAP